MSAPFTLDTSGYVEHPKGSIDVSAIYWHDLTPFAQGYVEALLTPCEATHYSLTERHAGFSDLSPEALATILVDCERWIGDQRVPNNPEEGAIFWRERQNHFSGRHAGRSGNSLRCDRYPSLTVFLADDGKIHLKAVV